MRNRTFFMLCIALILVGCGKSPSQAQQRPTYEVFNPPPIVTATIPGAPAPQVTPTRSLLLPDSLSSAEVLARLDPFHSPIAPEGCALPCFDGLVIGQASPNDVYDFYAHLGIGLSDLIPGDFEAFRNDGAGRLGAWLTKTHDAAIESATDAPQVAVFMADYLAQSVYVTWSTQPDYLSVPQVLRELGEPIEMRLGLVLDQSPAPYILELAYPDHQTSFIYYGTAAGDASKQQICLSADQGTSALMNIVKSGDPLSQQTAYSQYLLPISETLSMDYAAFATAVTTTDCIDVPASAWPAWQAITP